MYYWDLIPAISRNPTDLQESYYYSCFQDDIYGITFHISMEILWIPRRNHRKISFSC